MGLFDKLNQMKQEKADKAIQAGKDYLEKNAQRPDVTTTESGLQYEVITMGEGKKPYHSSSVTCHYKGYTIDGNVFDSSYQRNAPATFPLNRVIPGWTEGLQLMPIGSTFKFHIPYDLGYGDRQVSADIPAYSTLIFEVELIDFK